ncbi:MAG: UvrB/UvrC motif-containing protein [Limnochordales bacterium]|nr:MAG: hypothetical protein DIU83_06210 [Bacillota bacterium]
MLCEQCKQAPATVHITQIVNDTKREMHLCEDCAGQVAGETGTAWPGISFSKLLGGLLAPEAVAGLATAAPASGGRCPNCGLSFADFRRLGHLGCSECHVVFSQQLEPVLRRIHGSTVHAGKIPARQAGPLRLQRELEGLRQELKEAIGKEDYERAAVLRDRIRLLERHGG